jgi:SAM-dependent methyltransferase
LNADEYLKLAEVEDRMWYFRSLHAHVRRELRAALGAAGGPRGEGNVPHVLDAGCGTGGLILRLRAQEPAWRWSGLDFMPLACELARRRLGPEVEIREGSITALPFADATFDSVTPVDVISQVDDAAGALREVWRVLKPGGVAVFNTPAYMWMWSYHDESCQTKHRYTRPELAAMLATAGFRSARLTHWNAIPFPLIWARRKLLRAASDTSDVKDYPAIVDGAFRAAMAVEHAWLRAGGAWAWGSSIFAVARKPGPMDERPRDQKT